MIYRKVLIVHESMIIRSLLKGYILSECNDIQLLETKSIDEAQSMLNEHEIDIIFSGQHFRKSSGIELQQFKNASGPSANVPLVIFTSSSDQRNIDELKLSGIEHLLISPFTSKELGNVINTLCDPKKLRRVPRFNIPDVTAELVVRGSTLTASVMNISQSGALLEVKLAEHYPDIFNSIIVSIQFPQEYKNTEISQIYSRILNSRVVKWNDSGKPQVLQLSLLFEHMNKSTLQKWETVLSNIKETYDKWASTHF